jgi:hypothetical protein
MNDTENPRCLLTTPRSGEFSSRRQLIADALRESGMEPVLVGETTAAATSMATVPQAIDRADCIIADLTGSDPNVMYEVGFAHALRKPVLPIIQNGPGHIPFNMAGYLFVVYDPSEPEELRHHIQTWARRYLNEREGR